MLGGMFAGTDETPGTIKVAKDAPMVLVGGLPEHAKFKVYRGSASKESYADQGKVASHRSPEGEWTVVEYKGPVANVVQQIEGGLRSALSYVGADGFGNFYNNAELVEISNSTVVESRAHGKRQ
jgi:IMP dehydrogenase